MERKLNIRVTRIVKIVDKIMRNSTLLSRHQVPAVMHVQA
jgi:hypothetical protein